jgi:hypothetical protein
MDQINLLIQKYNIPTEDNEQNISLSNEDSYYYLDPNTEKNNNNLSTINSEKIELENSLIDYNQTNNNFNNINTNLLETENFDNNKKKNLSENYIYNKTMSNNNNLIKNSSII